jgi:hypothetical protein
MEIPEPLYMENVGKSVRADFSHDYDTEERQHCKKMQKYKLHPLWPLKAQVPLTQEKDIEDRNGGFGNDFWPDQREQAKI